MDGMITVIERRAENCDESVTNVLVHQSAMRFDDFGHGRQIRVHERYELARRHGLGDGREPDEIREEHCDGAHLAAEYRWLLRRHQLLDDLGREIERKALPQQALIFVGDDEAVTDGRAEREKSGD